MAQAVGGPDIPNTDANAPSGMVPFRRATTQRTQLLTTESHTLTTSQQAVEVPVGGTGLIYRINLEVECLVTGQSLGDPDDGTMFKEDGPWSALASVILSDINGQAVNLTGFHLYLMEKYGGWNPHSTTRKDSSDALLYNADENGNFKFFLSVPVALNRRNLIGLLGNQDRAQKYTLRTDFAPLADIYTTAGVAAVSTNAVMTVKYWYDSYAIPQERNAAGAVQQRLPDTYGVLHFLTQQVNPTPPVGGSGAINHYVPRVGNVLRNHVAVFRKNGSRADAEVYMPSLVTFKMGDTVIWNESAALRRAMMYERFGFDADDGILVWDRTTDLGNAAGSEMGDDWEFTAGVVQTEFDITYPSGLGSTNNSLIILTDDLMVPPGLDPFAG